MEVGSNVQNQIATQVDDSDFDKIEADALKIATAKALIPSDLSGKNVDFVKVAIMKRLAMGRALGLKDAVALNSIIDVRGKLTLPTSMMFALCLKRGLVAGFREELTEDKDEDGNVINKTHRVWIKRTGIEGEFEGSFSWRDAERAQLTKGSVWEKYPQLMMKWRSVCNALRVGYSDITNGLHDPEELREYEEPKKQAIKEARTNAYI